VAQVAAACPGSGGRPEPEWRPIPSNFSSDGFHASEAGYREWAGNLANFILELESAKSAGMAPQLSPFAE
jgi:lysophospholipase L1-like esterase